MVIRKTNDIRNADSLGAVEKGYIHRNPVMPSRTKATIIYKVNQACRGRGYLCGTPECLRTLQN